MKQLFVFGSRVTRRLNVSAFQRSAVGIRSFSLAAAKEPSLKSPAASELDDLLRVQSALEKEPSKMTPDVIASCFHCLQEHKENISSPVITNFVRFLHRGMDRQLDSFDLSHLMKIASSLQCFAEPPPYSANLLSMIFQRVPAHKLDAESTLILIDACCRHPSTSATATSIDSFLAVVARTVRQGRDISDWSPALICEAATLLITRPHGVGSRLMMTVLAEIVHYYPEDAEPFENQHFLQFFNVLLAQQDMDAIDNKALRRLLATLGPKFYGCPDVTLETVILLLKTAASFNGKSNLDLHNFVCDVCDKISKLGVKSITLHQLDEFLLLTSRLESNCGVDRRIISAVSNLVRISFDKWDAGAVVNALYSLRNKSSFVPEVKKLVASINMQLETHLDVVIPFNQLHVGVSSLAQLSSEHSDVRQLFSFLAQFVERSPHEAGLVDTRGNNQVAKAFIGLAGSNCDHVEVKVLMMALAGKLSVEKQCFNTEDIAFICKGLQGKSWNHKIVPSVMRIVATKMATLPADQMFSLRQVCTVLRCLLQTNVSAPEIRKICKVLGSKIVVPKSKIDLFSANISLEILRQILLTYKGSAIDETLTTCPKELPEYSQLLTVLNATASQHLDIQRNRPRVGLVSLSEDALRPILEDILRDYPHLSLESNATAMGFECDFLIGRKDAKGQFIPPILDLEIDGGLHQGSPQLLVMPIKISFLKRFGVHVEQLPLHNVVGHDAVKHARTIERLVHNFVSQYQVNSEK